MGYCSPTWLPVHLLAGHLGMRIRADRAGHFHCMTILLWRARTALQYENSSITIGARSTGRLFLLLLPLSLHSPTHLLEERRNYLRRACVHCTCQVHCLRPRQSFSSFFLTIIRELDYFVAYSSLFLFCRRKNGQCHTIPPLGSLLALPMRRR